MTFRDPAMPLVNNADARIVRGGDACREGLVRQVSAPVRWLEAVQALVAEGVDTVVEVGPGTVLSGLVKKIDKGLRVLAVEDPASLEATIAALAEAR
jgi:[acyl-carrier-protein] S-malonyltransferase